MLNGLRRRPVQTISLGLQRMLGLPPSVLAMRETCVAIGTLAASLSAEMPPLKKRGKKHYVFNCTHEARAVSQDVLIADETFEKVVFILKEAFEDRSRLRARVEELERENFALAAQQCTRGHAMENGDFRCCCKSPT